MSNKIPQFKAGARVTIQYVPARAGDTSQRYVGQVGQVIHHYHTNPNLHTVRVNDTVLVLCHRDELLLTPLEDAKDTLATRIQAAGATLRACDAEVAAAQERMRQAEVAVATAKCKQHAAAEALLQMVRGEA